MKAIKEKIKENEFLFFLSKCALVPHKMLYKYFTNMGDIFFSVVYFNSITLPIRNHLTIGVKKLGMARVYFPHPIGLVIGKNVKIGKFCKIYQNVTIGARNDLAEAYPEIGNNVTIYANAIIIGDIVIGDNCVIGAGTLVNKSLPANSIAVGNPVRVINK